MRKSVVHDVALKDADFSKRPSFTATNTGQHSFSYRDATVWNSLGKQFENGFLAIVIQI